MVERERHGKAEAVNQILAKAKGRFVLLTNSDASPERGALVNLLAAADSDQNVGAVSAIPVTDARKGPTALFVNFMWSTHNECSVALNHMNLSNHSSDELVVFKTSAIKAIPAGIVNDGAYLAATVRRKGFSVKVSPSAKVRIETPKRISDIVHQRRRILFGHVQVWRRIGEAPRTIESLILSSPPLGLNLLVKTLARHPKFILVIPIAVVTELAALVLSISDVLRSSKIHTVWRRFS